MSILDWVKLLSSLTDEEKNNLSFFCQKKRVSNGERIFGEWDIANAMYILVSWIVEISSIKNWKKIVLWKVEPEEILWEMALFWEKWVRMATAKAIEDTVLITILSFSIKDLTNKYPRLLDKIKDIIKWRILNNQLFE